MQVVLMSSVLHASIRNMNKEVAMKMKNKRMHEFPINALRIALEIYIALEEEKYAHAQVLLGRYMKRKYPSILKVWDVLDDVSVLPTKVEV